MAVKLMLRVITKSTVKLNKELSESDEVAKKVPTSYETSSQDFNIIFQHKIYTSF